MHARPCVDLPLPPGLQTEFTTTAYNHMGPLTYRDSELERIDTPNGFIGDGGVNYYVKDYQGSVRQVLDDEGAVLQDNHYYSWAYPYIHKSINK